MKALKFVMTVSLSVATIVACQNSKDKHWDSKSTADTLNTMKDSVTDTGKSITKGLVMKTNRVDAKFAVDVADGGLAEVELGKLAQQKATNQQIKEFGAMMVSDHSVINEKMKNIAKNKGITLPKIMGDYQEKLRKDLSDKSGKDFDRAYVTAMIKDHKEDIKTFEVALKELRDTDLRTFASTNLPILKKHLSAIEKIDTEMK
jgi:putative membrane protein